MLFVSAKILPGFQCCQRLAKTFRPNQAKNLAAGEKVRPLKKYAQ
jgi:hypothetical protein